MAIPEALGTVVTVVKAMYQVMEFLKSITDPEPATIRELYNRLNSVELDVRKLESDVANLTHELRRGAVIDLTRDIDAQRAAMNAAVIYAADHKGDTASELSALTAAIALGHDSFYTFPARVAGGADRFDSRAALPSYIEAVSSWILLRRYNGTASTPTSKDTLIRFSNILSGLAHRIRGAVTAVEVYTSYDHPLTPPPKPRFPPRKLEPGEEPPPPPPTERRCSHVIYVVDPMAESTTYQLKETTVGDCGNSQRPHDAAKQKYLDDAYLPDRLDDIVAYWRLVATT